MLYKELKQLLSQIKKQITCPSCSRHYTEGEMTIVGTINDETILHLNCQECGSQALVNAMINRYSEARRHQGLKVRNLEKADLPAITSDDILDIHNFLQNFEGDFKNLFSK